MTNTKIEQIRQYLEYLATQPISVISTDPKPIGQDGDKLFEMDTGLSYYWYDNTWNLDISGGGGSGGQGPPGPRGLSAYEVYVANVPAGVTPLTEVEWLGSLKGEEGANGKSAYGVYVDNVPSGTTPLDEVAWLASLKGADGGEGPAGDSAYDSYVKTTEDDPVKTEEQWLASLKGQDGTIGSDGKSAYELYVEVTSDDPVKTEQEWLESLEGKSAYEYAVEEGFEGDEEAFGELLASLGDLPDFSNVEVTTNKITSWGSPTDAQYASAKLTKTELDKKEVSSNKITRLYEGVTDTQYASAKAVYDEFQILKRAQVLESWEMFSDVIKENKASDFVTAGDRLVGYWEDNGVYVPVTWEVLGIDQDEAVDESILHTVTLGTVDCLFSAMFDNPETNNPDSDRKNYGNNNWELSNIRQYLNSEDAPFVFSPTHDYDTAPTGYPTNGFLARLHPTMKEVIVPVKKWVSLANIDVEGGVSDKQLEETIFLLSQVEVNGGTGSVGTVTNEFVYQRYTSGSRIKYHVATAREWWLRSPHVGLSSYVRYVSTTGYMNRYRANDSSSRVAPACVIG